MKKSLLYTRTGDSGTTSLVGGQRVAKDSVRLEAYGSVDELNSAIGFMASVSDFDDSVAKLVYFIQNKLFDIGAYLATEDSAEYKAPLPVCVADIERLEAAIDEIDSQLPQLRSFVLPAGSQSACAAHMARTVARRAERRIITLSHQAAVDADVIKFVNRLSDLFFALARFNNVRAGITEIFWCKSC